MRVIMLQSFLGFKVENLTQHTCIKYTKIELIHISAQNKYVPPTVFLINLIHIIYSQAVYGGTLLRCQIHSESHQEMRY
jgi:hypothetical protein